MAATSQSFTEAERLAIRYLQDEIDWARRAGRVLIGFMLGSSLSYLLAASQVDLDPAFRALSAGISSAVLLVAFMWFRYYFRRVASQKSHLQAIIRSKLSGDTKEHFEEAIEAERLR